MRAICSKQSTLKPIRLRCKECGRFFHTKNIQYVGARSIYPEREDCEHDVAELELIEPEKIDMKSFREELALFNSQERTQWDIDRIFKESYGKTSEEILG